jgi:polar amino acid transport system substrate-binding protein
MRRRLLGSIAPALAALILAGLLGHGTEALAQSATSSVIDEIKTRGLLRVGISLFMPRAMRAKDGKLVGFDVDVATKVAEDLGVKLELVQTAWDGIIPALYFGRFDVIISGMTITPDRNLSVNFTAPYATDDLGLVASRKLAGDFKTVEDFNKPGVKLAVRRGAAPTIAVVRRLFPKATMLEFDDDNQALADVLGGKAHGVLSGEPRPTFWRLDNPDTLVQPLDRPLLVNARAIALRRGDVDTLNFFNNWILVHTLNGWLKERHEYWFKSRKWVEMVPKP